MKTCDDGYGGIRLWLSVLDTAGESGGNCWLNIFVPQNVSVLASYRSPSLAMRPSACRVIVSVLLFFVVSSAIIVVLYLRTI